MSYEAAITVRNLKKNYTTYLRKGLFKREKKIVEALKGISFEVYRGEVFGLLGPNGAGKTTTVKILSTLLLPDGGEAKILGFDVVKEAAKVRKVIGVSLTVEKGFFWKLTGRENLTYFGMLYGIDGEPLKRRVEEVLDMVGLKSLGVADKLYEEYSLGMKARLSIARALITNPEVLILDEPTLGLDPPSARTLRELLVRIAHEERKTVLVTTHNMFEAEIVCDRIAIINEGRIIALDTVEKLKESVADNISLEIFALLPANISVKTVISAIKNKTSLLSDAFAENGGFRIKVVIPPKESDEATSKILRLLHEYKCSVRRVEVKEPTLEDVFIQLTGRKGF
ncbi:MAG: ABC transporter [Thermofilum sp. ex4484_82]|nr:MAG: ABC transporter [Thermofilum sp. ex4484_82]OYT39779.1 MAG: ABC transporter [Archaeoglobales archaeon ex4484_92]